jgi:CRISPR system Cascade subunit CasD
VYVAVQATPRAPYPLDEVARALDRPRFVLYLGRKAAPPALPLGPMVVEANTMREAFERGVTLPDQLEAAFRKRSRTDGGREAFVWEEGIDSGVPVSRMHWRNDEPLSRDRWQFGRRREFRGRQEVQGE